MTRRFTCYVVFATLIWGAHTQKEEEVRGDMFKSNMTRNDFSNLLSSLIKLNEQRVSVLQRLHKLEDYGVLSEVLRSGDRESENGNPNNLFLIVMSKNESDPSRRNAGFEVVDTVRSLDIGSKKVHPKLKYVLDPAGYFSQNTLKENPIESIFENIPIAHRPKKRHLINDGSKKIITTVKPLKHHKPGQKTEVSYDANILRSKKTGLKANREIQNRKENNKFEIVSNDRSTKPSQKLRNFDKSNNYPPVGYHDPPHYPEIYVTKIISIEDTISNNREDKDREDVNDYGSQFSQENVENSANQQDTKTDSDISIKKTKFNRNKYILNNQGNKDTIIKADIKSTTSKNDLRSMSTTNSNKTDTISNNKQNDKNPLEDKDEKDENYYDSPFSEEYDDNGPNRKYTKINIDTPKENLQGNQHPKFNRSKSVLNNLGDKYTIIVTEIKTTTSKTDLRIVSTVNSDKTDTLSHSQNDKFPVEDKVLEGEDYYGSPFSKEYDENGPDRQSTIADNYNLKVNVLNEHYPKLNRSKSILNNETTAYSTKETVITITTAKNYIKEMITLNSDKASEINHSIENPNIYIDLKNSKIMDEHVPKEIGHSNKFPSLASENTSVTKIPKTAKVMQYKNDHDYDYPKDVGNDTNKDNPGIARGLPSGVNYSDVESQNDKYHGNENPSPPNMVSENVDGKTIPTNSSLRLKNVADNSNKYKKKAAKDLGKENNKNVNLKKHKDRDSKEKFDEREEFIIDKKDNEEFSIIVTHLGKDKPEKIKQPDNHRINSKAFDHPEGKPIQRKAFQKCLNKKAKKLCCKSCISAYKNVCQRLKCTSKAKRALKKECKRSCKKTFASSSSKYSKESDESGSDESGSDDSGSDDSDSD